MNSYPRRETCKWWGERAEDDEGGSDYGTRFCTHPKTDSSSQSETDRIVVAGYRVDDGIATGPDFGCVHHEAKEAI